MNKLDNLVYISMKHAIKAFLPTAEAIQRLLHPFAEVVVHDIKQNKIVAIYHPFSKRRIGDSSMLSKEEISMLENCIGPYEKINWDGRKLKSVSSIIKDHNNEAVGLLCINLDISKLKKIDEFINAFINFNNFIPQPAALFKDDWQEKINTYIHRYLNEHHLTLESITRSEKKWLINHLYEIGAFSAKNSAIYIAQVLGVSKATIYNYLSDCEHTE